MTDPFIPPPPPSFDPGPAAYQPPFDPGPAAYQPPFDQNWQDPPSAGDSGYTAFGPPDPAWPGQNIDVPGVPPPDPYTAAPDPPYLGPDMYLTAPDPPDYGASTRSFAVPIADVSGYPTGDLYALGADPPGYLPTDKYTTAPDPPYIPLDGQLAPAWLENAAVYIDAPDPPDFNSQPAPVAVDAASALMPPGQLLEINASVGLDGVVDDNEFGKLDRLMAPDVRLNAAIADIVGPAGAPGLSSLLVTETPFDHIHAGEVNWIDGSGDRADFLGMNEPPDVWLVQDPQSPNTWLVKIQDPNPPARHLFDGSRDLGSAGMGVVDDRQWITIARVDSPSGSPPGIGLLRDVDDKLAVAVVLPPGGSLQTTSAPINDVIHVDAFNAASTSTMASPAPSSPATPPSSPLPPVASDQELGTQSPPREPVPGLTPPDPPSQHGPPQVGPPQSTDRVAVPPSGGDAGALPRSAFGLPPPLPPTLPPPTAPLPPGQRGLDSGAPERRLEQLSRDVVGGLPTQGLLGSGHSGNVFASPPGDLPPGGAPKSLQDHNFLRSGRTRPGSNLEEIQGLPMPNLLHRLDTLPRAVLLDEEGGKEAGGPRLVLAMRVVRAKREHDLVGFLQTNSADLRSIPPDQVVDVHVFFGEPEQSEREDFNFAVEVPVVVAKPSDLRLRGEPATKAEVPVYTDGDVEPISDFEAGILRDRRRILGAVLDPDTGEIIGYRVPAGTGLRRITDRNGATVFEIEASLENPVLDPIDFFPSPGTVAKVVTVGGKFAIKAAAGIGGKIILKEAAAAAAVKGAKTGSTLTLGVIFRLRQVSRALAMPLSRAGGKAGSNAVFGAGKTLLRPVTAQAARATGPIDEALLEAAVKSRKKLVEAGVDWAKSNVVTAKLLVDGKTVILAVDNPEWVLHAEGALITEVRNLTGSGKAVKVLQVFSERIPCGPGYANCMNNLTQAFPTAEIFYGLTGKLNEESTARALQVVLYGLKK